MREERKGSAGKAVSEPGSKESTSVIQVSAVRISKKVVRKINPERETKEEMYKACEEDSEKLSSANVRKFL